MDFRYKLAKEKFKGKKIPPKIRTNEDHISSDQQGNETHVDIPQNRILSLDQATSTAPKNEPGKDVKDESHSRRNLLSGLFGSYVQEGVEQAKQKPRKKKKRKVKKKNQGSEATLSSEAEPVSAESPAAPLAIPEATPSSRPGFFRRCWIATRDWFRSPLAADLTAEEQAPAASEPLGSSSLNGSEPQKPAAANPGQQQAPVTAEIPLPDEEEKEEEEPENELSRRNLLRQGTHFFAKPAVDSVQSKIDRINETVSKITKRVPLLRPPGAISERAFLQACTRCDKCIHACPPDALRRAPKSFGILIMGTPYIDSFKNPCVMCDDLPCIPACPEAALLPVASPAEVNMGYAILNKDRCMAYTNIFCQQCVIDCPIPGAITQDQYQQPSIHKNVCTGCGVCVRSCNTVNIPVAIKVKPFMVIESQLRKKEMEKQQAEKDAERKARKLEEARQELLAQQEEENP